MESKELQAAIEGLLFVMGEEGLSITQLADVLELDEGTIQKEVRSLQNLFEEQKRGLQIIELAGGYRLTTREKHAAYFKKLATSPLQSTLSQAALETLAIIAYRQPITRMEIEEIRGVKSERAIQTLTTKLLIQETGRVAGVGRPIIYGTTTFFLDHFGLKDLEDLPPLPESVDERSLEDETDLFFSKLEEMTE